MDLKELAARIEKSLKDIRDRYEADIKKFGDETAGATERIEQAASEITELKTRLDELETENNRLPTDTVRDLKDRKAVTAEVLAQKYTTDQLNALYDPAVTGLRYGDDSDERSDERKAVDIAHSFLFWKGVRAGGGPHALSQDEHSFVMNVKASVISDDTNAGYLLVPNQTVAAILGNVREFSPIRQLADVRTGSAHAIEEPRRTADISASWVAEQGTRSETTGLTHGMEVITAHECYAQLHASRQMLGDAAYDLESYFAERAGEAFGVLEGTAFVNGTAVGQPEGITGNSNITTTSAATSGTIAADDIRQIPYDLKEPYRSNATWLWNRQNIGRVMILKDGQGQYLWKPGLVAGQPATLDGYPIREATDLASTESASENAALFADFRRGYRVYDRLGMQMIRDPITSKDTGLVEFDFYRRVGGGVILPEAIVLYQL